MTLEQALLIAISSLVAALSWAVRQLWASARRCESDRASMNARLTTLEHENGIALGRLEHFENCPPGRCLLKGGSDAKKATTRIMPRTA